MHPPDFGYALNRLREGKRMYRNGWNDEGVWIELCTPQPPPGVRLGAGVQEVNRTLPYLVMIYPQRHSAYSNGARVPWVASQTDLLAEDWHEMLP